MISFMDIISPQDNFMDIISPQKSKKSLRIYYIRRNGYNKSAKVEKMHFADIISPQRDSQNDSRKTKKIYL